MSKRQRDTKWLNQLRAEAIELVNKSNSKFRPERQVTVKAALTVVDRSLVNTRNASEEVRKFAALRALSSFISLATVAKTSVMSLENSDLLPVGHPFSTAPHAMTIDGYRRVCAQWIASDPLIDDSMRSLVASAHALEPGSIERQHAFARLAAAGPKLVPITASIDVGDINILNNYAPVPLVAGLLSFIGGNSRAARSMRAKLQRRDRYGRFAFMGGGFSFKMKMNDGSFRSFSGRVVGRGGEKDDGLVEVELLRGSNGINVAGQIVKVPANKGTAVKAIIPQEGLKDLPDQGEVQPDDVFVTTAQMIQSKTGAPEGWKPVKMAKDAKGNQYATQWESPDGYVVNGVGAYSHSDDYENVGPGSAGWATHRQPQLQPARKELDFVDFPAVDTWAEVEDLLSRDQNDYEADLKKYNSLDGNDAAQKAWVADQEAKGRKNAADKPQILREETDAFAEQLQDAVGDDKGIRFTANGEDVTLKPTEVTETSVKGTDAAGNEREFKLTDIEVEAISKDASRVVSEQQAAKVDADGNYIDPDGTMEGLVGDIPEKDLGVDQDIIDSRTGSRLVALPDTRPEDADKALNKFYNPDGTLNERGIRENEKRAKKRAKYLKELNNPKNWLYKAAPGDPVARWRWVGGSRGLDGGNEDFIYTPNTPPPSVVAWHENENRKWREDQDRQAQDLIDNPRPPLLAPGERPNIYDSRVSDSLEPGQSGPDWSSTVSATRGGKPTQWTHTPTAGRPTHTVTETFDSPGFGEGEPVRKYSAWRDGNGYGLPGGNKPVGGGETWNDAMDAIKADMPETEKLIAERDAKAKPSAPVSVAPQAPSAALLGEPSAPGNINPVADIMETKYIESRKMYKMRDVDGSTGIFSEDDVYDAQKDGFTMIGQVSGGTTTRRVPKYRPSTGVTRDLLPFETPSQRENALSEALRAGDNVRFKYGAKEVVFQPAKIYTNQKNGNRNITGWSVTDGEERTYNIDKISAVAPKAKPKPEPAKAEKPAQAATGDLFGDMRGRDPKKFAQYKDIYGNEPDEVTNARMALDELYAVPMGRSYTDPVTGQELGSKDIADLAKKYDKVLTDWIAAGKPMAAEAPAAESDIVDFDSFTDSDPDLNRRRVQMAMDNGQKLRVGYKGKDRVIDPQRLWTNPKTGKEIVTALDISDEGKEKNFFVEELSAPKTPTEVKAPVVSEPQVAPTQGPSAPQPQVRQLVTDALGGFTKANALPDDATAREWFDTLLQDVVPTSGKEYKDSFGSGDSFDHVPDSAQIYGGDEQGDNIIGKDENGQWSTWTSDGQKIPLEGAENDPDWGSTDSGEGMDFADLRDYYKKPENERNGNSWLDFHFFNETQGPSAPSEGPVDLTPIDPDGLRPAIEDAIANKKDVSFLYHEKPRVVQPLEITVNPKNNRPKLRAFEYAADAEKEFFLDKFDKPVDEKLKQAELDDIINLPQEELDQFVDAMWPAQAVPAPAVRTQVTGLQEIDTKGSTAVNRAAYDPQTQELFIQFAAKDGGGGVYKYADVPQDFADRFAAADSLGKMIPELKKMSNGEKINEFPSVVDSTPVPGEIDDSNIVERDDRRSRFTEEKFDELYPQVAEGFYKVNTIDRYVPKGPGPDVQSPDYTDNPDTLASKFGIIELLWGLKDAISPDENTGAPATGYALLKFDNNEEYVSAEAIYAAIAQTATDVDILLAGIYDRGAGTEENTDAAMERSTARAEAAAKAPIDDLSKSIIETTDLNRYKQLEQARILNGLLANPNSASRVVRALDNFVEPNEKIIEVADRLQWIQDNNPDPERVNLDSFLDQYLPLAESPVENDRDAFRAVWGLLMAMDGGDTVDFLEAENPEDDEHFRAILFRALVRSEGSDIAAQDAYEDLVSTYGGYAEFVAGRKRLADGEENLNSKTVAAAFTRLVAAAARPNVEKLTRYIGISKNDDSLGLYLTEGAMFDMDPRSFTSKEIIGKMELGIQEDPRNEGLDELFFVLEPGQGNSVQTHMVSPFAHEKEHFAYGTYEVVSSKSSFIKFGSMQERHVVTIRKVDTNAPALTAPDSFEPTDGVYVPDYGDISSWKEVRPGSQLGSNEGGFFRDASGNQYYIKRGRSQSHVDNETLATALYRELGIPAPAQGFGLRDGELYLVSPIISDRRGFEDMLDDADFMRKVRDGFAVDAWLSNYDVTGLVFDNIVPDENNDPIRIDNGGALRWRASGGDKPWFDNDPSEIDSMRDPDLARIPAAAEVFGEMTEDDVAQSARKLLDISPSQIQKIVKSAVKDPDEAQEIADTLVARREKILGRYGLDTVNPDADILGEPTSLATSMGYEARDLQPEDVTAGDSFVIERVFHDADTPKGKVSVEGYFPGHETQRKEWNEGTVIDVFRGAPIPPKGDKPALHRPKRPFEPKPPAFTGSAAQLLDGASGWEEVRDRLRGTEIIFFDYETTGFPDRDKGDFSTNQPVQLGAVRVVNGEVIDRFNVYMNPGEALGLWSRENLKRDGGVLVTDEWLAEQPGKDDVHRQFTEWAGENAIFAAHNAPFDIDVFNKTVADAGIDYAPAGVIDTLKLSQQFMPSQSQKVKPDANGPLNHKLPTLVGFFGGTLEGWHSADVDAEAVAGVLDGILNAITDKPLPDLAKDAQKYARDKENFDRAKKEYTDALLEYETAKAVAAAWNCGGGGGGFTAAGDEYGDDCNVPTVEEIITRATPDASDFVDPDGIHSGPTDGSSSPLPDRGADDLEDYVIQFPENVDPAELFSGEKFMPTLQQQNIIAAWLTGEDVVVLAKAGTGKTTTLTLGARVVQNLQPGKKLLYIAYNRSVADEARAKFPPNTEVKTSDAVAFSFVRTQYPDLFKKFKSETALFNKSDIATFLGLSSVTIGDEKYEASEIASMVQDAIFKFEISSDPALSQKHVAEADVPMELRDTVFSAAQMYFSDILNPDGKMPFAFNEMKKLWSMSKPDFSGVDSGVNMPIDVVMLDEAQDTNDAVGSVVLNQPIQVIMVGDPDQAIYQFNGAKDQLQNAVAPYRLPLTESWRYGPEIGGFANRFLALKERVYEIETNRGIGRGPTGEVVTPGTMSDAEAVIVRSNAGAFGDILKEIDNGRTVGVTKSFYADLKGFIEATEWLKAGGASSGKKRPGRMPEDLRGFRSWKEVVAEAEKGDKSDLGSKTKILVDTVESEGIEGLYDILGKIRQIESVSDAKKNMGDGTSVAPSEFDIPDEVGVGAYGQLTDGISFAVDPVGIAITGKKTFQYKEEIKKAGAKWNGDSKVWKIPATTDDARRAALEKLQKALRDLEGFGSTTEDRAAQGIDVVVSTAHQMKGLEFGRVRVGSDFRGPRKDKDTGEMIWPSVSEFNLAYVTATRAINALDPGSLEWIYKFSGDQDESPFPQREAPEAETEAEDIVPTPETGDESGDGGAEEPPAVPTAPGGDEPSDDEKSVYDALDVVYYAIQDAADSKGNKDFGAKAGINALIDMRKNLKGIFSDNPELNNLVDEVIAGIEGKKFDYPEDGVADAQKKLPAIFGREAAPQPGTVETAQDDTNDVVTSPDEVTIDEPITDEQVEEIIGDVPELAGTFNLQFIRDRFAEVDQLFTEAENNMVRPSSKTTVAEVREAVNEVLRDLVAGNITLDDAYEKLAEVIDNVPQFDIKSKNPDADEIESLGDYVASIRDSIEEVKYGRRLHKDLPPPDLLNKAGEPMGTSKNGILIRPGMRVRDKNGFAGRALGYNKSDWVGVFVRFELDPREQASVKKGNWGPGVARVIRTASTLEVIGEDEAPWADVRTDAQKKKDADKGVDPRPPSYDQQLEIYNNMIKRRTEEAWSGEESDRSDGGGDDNGPDGGGGGAAPTEPEPTDSGDGGATPEPEPAQREYTEADATAAANRVNEDIRDSGNEGYTDATSQSFLQQLSKEVKNAGPDDKKVTVKLDYEVDVDIEDAKALLAYYLKEPYFPKVEAPEGATEASEELDRWKNVKPISDPGAFLSKVEDDVQRENSQYAKFVEKWQYRPEDHTYNIDGALYYMSGGAEDVNAWLANVDTSQDPYPGKYTEEWYKTTVKTLDKLINLFPKIKKDIIAYRGVHSRRENDPLIEMLSKLQPGDEFTNVAYSSTSIVKSVADGFAKDGYLLEIVVPRGTKGMFADPAIGVKFEEPDAYSDPSLFIDLEAELVLPRNTTFRVLSRDGDTIRVVVADAASEKPVELPKQEQSSLPITRREYTPAVDPKKYQENLGEIYDNALGDEVNEDNAAAMRMYQEDDEAWIVTNERLRGTKPLVFIEQDYNVTLEDIGSIVKAFDEEIDKVPGLPSDTLLYRGVREKAANDLFSLGVGEEFTDLGFASTSLEYDTAEMFSREVNALNGVILEIEAPAGTRGISLAAYFGDTTDSESEIVLARGTTFVVLSKTESIDGESRRMRVAIVSQDEAVKKEPVEVGEDNVSYNGIENWTKIGAQQGSNPGGTYRDANGDTYYVKRPKSDLHAQNEALASALYNELGIPAVQVFLGEENGELRTVSPMIESSGILGYDPDENLVKEIQDGFAVDAWLANWDVAGLVFDNIIIDKSGNPVRVDPGGALMWRAQGEPKGKFFGDQAGEIDTLRDEDMAPEASVLFGEMTEYEMKESAKHLLDISPERIDEIVDSIVTEPDVASDLKQKLKNRRQDILDRFSLSNVDKLIGPSDELDAQENQEQEQPQEEPSVPVKMEFSEWRNGSTTYVDEAGVTVGVGVNYNDVIGLKNGSIEPPALPFFVSIYDDDDSDSGEGYYFAKSGKRYWGRYGAAGTLLRRLRSDGQYEYLLAKRSAYISAGGGQWAWPGGAHKDKESAASPQITAYEELKEELGFYPKGLNPVASHTNFVEPDWKYETLIVDVTDSSGVDELLTLGDGENSDFRWFTKDQIDALNNENMLHPAVATSVDDVISISEENSSDLREVASEPELQKPTPVDMGEVKVLPTGRPKVVPSNPLPISASAVEGTYSLMDAIHHVKNSDDVAVSALVDGGDVEDLEVRASVVVDEATGEKKVALRFKLTTWAANKLLDPIRFVRDNNKEDVLNSNKRKALKLSDDLSDAIISESQVIPKKSYVDPTNGTVVETDKPAELVNISRGVNRPALYEGSILTIDDSKGKTGAVYEIVDEAGDEFEMPDYNIPVEQRPFAHEGPARSYNNMVKIYLPLDASEEQVTRALKAAGIQDVRSGSREDLDVIAENRLLSLFKYFTDPSTNIDDQQIRDIMLESIKKEEGISIEDIEYRVSDTGRLEMLLPESKAKELAKRLKIQRFQHEMSNMRASLDYYDENPNIAYGGMRTVPRDYIEKRAAREIIETLTTDRLRSTMTRMLEGNQNIGMSSDSDIEKGSADYVFTTPDNDRRSVSPFANEGHEQDLTSTVFVFSAEKLLRRLDIYGNRDDVFGERSEMHDIYGEIDLGKGRAYEAMFKNDIDFGEYLMYVSTAEGIRYEILSNLYESGITTMYGIPVEELFVVHGDVPNRKEVASEIAKNAERVEDLQQKQASMGASPIDYNEFGQVVARVGDLYGGNSWFIPAPYGSKIIGIDLIEPRNDVRAIVLEPSGALFSYSGTDAENITAFNMNTSYVKRRASEHSTGQLLATLNVKEPAITKFFRYMYGSEKDNVFTGFKKGVSKYDLPSYIPAGVVNHYLSEDTWRESLANFIKWLKEDTSKDRIHPLSVLLSWAASSMPAEARAALEKIVDDLAEGLQPMVSAAAPVESTPSYVSPIDYIVETGSLICDVAGLSTDYSTGEKTIRAIYSVKRHAVEKEDGMIMIVITVDTDTGTRTFELKESTDLVFNKKTGIGTFSTASAQYRIQPLESLYAERDDEIKKNRQAK